MLCSVLRKFFLARRAFFLQNFVQFTIEILWSEFLLLWSHLKVLREFSWLSAPKLFLLVFERIINNMGIKLVLLHTRPGKDLNTYTISYTPTCIDFLYVCHCVVLEMASWSSGRKAWILLLSPILHPWLF